VAISLGFGPADLARCRFAYSPMFETLAAVRIATGPQGPGPGPHHPRWLQQTRPRLRALDLRPITLLQPRRGYTPDFLSPPPLSPFSDFAAELTRMSATPAPVVHQEIEMSLLETPGAQTSELGRLLLGDPAEVLSLLTQLVRAAWHALVEPVWPRVRAALEADIAYQSRRLAEGGLDNLFADLDQTLSWTGHTLVRDRGGNEHVELAGRGVLLMPSAFKWDEAIVITEPPGNRPSSTAPGASATCGSRQRRPRAPPWNDSSGAPAPRSLPGSLSRPRRCGSRSDTTWHRARSPSTSRYCVRQGWWSGNGTATRSGTGAPASAQR